MAAIYVGTYAKYNQGSIQGAWLDCSDYADKDAFYKACADLHSDEVDPEFMFQDFEDCADFVSESGIDDGFFEFLALDEDDRELLTAYRDNIDQTGTLEIAQEAYI